jgi:hypothetical protein
MAILADASVYSDDERIERIFDILTQASAKHRYPEVPRGFVRVSRRKSRRTETGQLNARQVSAYAKRLSDRISTLQPGFGLPVGCLCLP